MSRQRKRMFEVSTRVDLLPESKIIEALTENSIDKWAYIAHDKDVNDSGEKINSHWHVMIYTSHATTITAVAKWFGVEEQQIEFIKSRYFADALIYLTHEMSEDKYRYEDDEVKSKEGYNWLIERNERLTYRINNPNKKEVDALIEKALDGKIRGYHVGSELLPASVYHDNMRRFDDAFLIFMRDIAPKRDIKKRVFFVTGESGAGKTSFAINYAKNYLQKDYYLSDGNNDPFQNYAGQPVLILDDFRANDMHVADVLKMFEQTGRSTGTARYRNKDLSAVEVIFVTVVTPESLKGKYAPPVDMKIGEVIDCPEELKYFHKSMKGSHEEDITQVTRRINFFVRSFHNGDSYVYVRLDLGRKWQIHGSHQSFETTVYDEKIRAEEDFDFLKQMSGGIEIPEIFTEEVLEVAAEIDAPL